MATETGSTSPRGAIWRVMLWALPKLLWALPEWLRALLMSTVVNPCL
jgi:hypothetical protein